MTLIVADFQLHFLSRIFIFVKLQFHKFGSIANPVDYSVLVCIVQSMVNWHLSVMNRHPMPPADNREIILNVLCRNPGNPEVS